MVLSRTFKVLSLSALLTMTGCGNRFFENGFVDPSEVGRFKSKPLVVTMLNQLDTGIEERSDKFANATDPRASDLVAVKTDYTIGAGDLVNVSVMDLVTEGVEWLKQMRVSDSGLISLPYVGQIKATGLSESQLEQSIVQSYQDKNMLPKAIVSVTVAEARNRSFSIYGAVTQVGQYAILQSDFRLLDALIQARDVTSSTGIDYIYVIRKSSRDFAGDSDTGTMSTTAPTTMAAPDSLAPKMRVMAADDTSGGPATQPTAGSAENRIIVVGDKPMDIQGGQAVPATPATEPVPSDMTMAPPMPGNATTMPSMPAASSGSFSFGGLAEPTDERIIKIPFDALRSGELKYNIVIRPEDTIWVPTPSAGVFYMWGHVQRTGVYNLTAQTITITQGVASAGGLDQLAIPQRTMIRRRLSPTREILACVNLEKIAAGEEPNIILKPDDEVQVGTNFFAPFLSAFREGFRITYGAGFIYDRNYNTHNNGN